MGAKRYCLGISVRGMLDGGDRNLAEIARSMTKPDGEACTLDEARTFFLDHLALGHEVIPYGACDRWDWVKGCGGHALPQETPASAAAVTSA